MNELKKNITLAFLFVGERGAGRSLQCLIWASFGMCKHQEEEMHRDGKQKGKTRSVYLSSEVDTLSQEKNPGGLVLENNNVYTRPEP